MSQEEFDAMFGEEGVGDVFDLLFGQHGRRRRRSAAMQGVDLDAETTLSLEEAYDGTTRIIELDGQTIRVKIKPGIEDGQVLRIAGKGGHGSNGGANGDLYITIRIAPHARFQRRGNDLYCEVPVELYTAVLGGKAEIKSLRKTVSAKIPMGTPNGKVLRLLRLGMPIYDMKSEFGNMYATVVVKLPDHLSEQEIDLFRKLAEMREKHKPASHM